MPDLSITALLSELHKQLNGIIEAPHETGLLLIAHVLNKPKTWVLAYPECKLTLSELNQVKLLTKRLVAGEPLPYITGIRAFYGLNFRVNKHVLIPRPETELLVDEALAWINQNSQAILAVDVGTGCGCIPISLATNSKNINFIASDISIKALETTKTNIITQQLESQISLVQSDLLSAFRCKFDLICANLPYIPTSKLTDVNTLGFEPLQALDGGKDGLRYIRLLLIQAKQRIKTPGLILLEIESSTGLVAIGETKDIFPNSKVSLIKDLCERDRLIKIEVGA